MGASQITGSFGSPSRMSISNKKTALKTVAAAMPAPEMEQELQPKQQQEWVRKLQRLRHQQIWEQHLQPKEQ
jgi:hypothetical protein